MIKVDVSDRVELKEEVVSLQSEFGRITDLLAEFQRKRATGIVYVDTLWEEKIERSAFLFRDGWIVYAGPTIPTPGQFLTEVSRHLKAEILQEALDFAAKRPSVHKVVCALAKVGVVSWSEVTAAVRTQVFNLLKELKGASGRVSFDASKTAFDLRYQDNVLGFAIDELLAEIDGQHLKNNSNPIVLSVDSNAMTHAIVEHHLGENYRVVSCKTAAEALATLEQEGDTVKYLMLDLDLPDMNGLELCKAARKQFKDLSIVLLASHENFIDRVRVHLAGANHYLNKAFLKANLLGAMAK